MQKKGAGNEQSHKAHDTSMEEELPRWSINKLMCFQMCKSPGPQRRGQALLYLNLKMFLLSDSNLADFVAGIGKAG